MYTKKNNLPRSIIRVIVFTLVMLFQIISVYPGEARAGALTPHLIPEEGFFGFSLFTYYHAAVNDRLLSSLPFIRKCQVVFMPSFSPEGAVFIIWDEKKVGVAPKVVAVELERQLWSEMQKHMRGEKSSWSGKPEDMKRVLPHINSNVLRAEADIDAKAAKMLESVWESMLLRVRHSKEEITGLDGENYHFANAVERRGYLTGKVWSPDKGTPASDLVEIAKALRDYPKLPETERGKSSQAITKMARKLLDKLKTYK
jgi:hypothetical protein